MKYITIILIILTIICLVYALNRFESFQSYGMIEGNRPDDCKVLIDSFMNDYNSSIDELEIPFMRWCYSYYYNNLGTYPPYRDAERVFKKLDHHVRRNTDYNWRVPLLG